MTSCAVFVVTKWFLPFAQVHHGFYYAYHNTSLRPGVISAVQKARELYDISNVMVTGHSMGGAIAAICGLDIRVNYMPFSLVSTLPIPSCISMSIDLL